METSQIVLWIITGIPLLAYPFVFIASAMSLAAADSGKTNPFLAFFARGAQWGSLAYPLLYAASLATALLLKGTLTAEWLCFFSWLPAFYLLLLLCFFVGWMLLGRRQKNVT